jgi:hypothetical protein
MQKSHSLSSLDVPPIDLAQRMSEISSIEELVEMEDVLPYKNKY